MALKESGSFIALAYERNAFPNRGEKCGPTLTIRLTFEHFCQNRGEKCGPTLTFSLTFSNPACKKGCPTFGTALYYCFNSDGLLYVVEAFSCSIRCVQELVSLV